MEVLPSGALRKILNVPGVAKSTLTHTRCYAARHSNMLETSTTPPPSLCNNTHEHVGSPCPCIPLILPYSDTVTQAVTAIQQGAVFYTDGSCDEPTSPYVARAAWAVVLRQANPNIPETQTITITASGHCPGHQSINRAELYAFLIATEQAICAGLQGGVGICTDSQFVMGIVEAVEQETVHHHPHKRAHWDLIYRLCQIWDSTKLFAFKIQSHRNLEDARTVQDLWNIFGNDCADRAAVQMRKTDLPEFDNLCYQVKIHYQEEHNAHKKNLLVLARPSYGTDEHGRKYTPWRRA